MGILVSLSGLDGSGKTTQGKKIMELCLNNGIKAHYVHLKTIDTKESYFNVIAEAKEYAKENGINVKSDKEEPESVKLIVFICQSTIRLAKSRKCTLIMLNKPVLM